MPSTRQWVERLSCAFAIVSVPYMSLLQLLHVLPRYHAPWEPMYILHALCGLFLCVNVSGIVYRLIRVDPWTRGRLVNSSEVTSAWRFCHACESHSPPRSHHCDVCDICVLKRDHHCLFSGSCVGLANQRYYLLTVAYFAIAATYAALFNWRFVLEAHDGLSPRSAFQLFIPFMAMCVGLSSPYQFCMAFTQAVCTMGGALLWTLLVFHLRLLLANQTTYERARRIRDYDLGWRANVAQVFGPGRLRWVLCLVWPLASAQPASDGFSFPMAGGGRTSGDGPRKTL